MSCRKFFALVLGMLMLLLLDNRFAFAGENAIYVSTNGSDSNKGSVSEPYLTIQRALDVVEPGQEIRIMGGIYYESLRINHSGDAANGEIRIHPYLEEKVVLDGSKILEAETDTMLEIRNQSNITIEGLEFRNIRSRTVNGILITEKCQNIRIQNCFFTKIDTSEEPGVGGGASAISVRSISEKDVIQNIDILSNTIYDCNLGFSEAIVLSGNVRSFLIDSNRVENVTNIGIDIAGHYNNFQGDVRYNQAREGIVSRNILMNCKSLYGAGAAAGIYVDGGKDITIKDNTVTECDYGIEVGCEKVGKKAENINVVDNTVYSNAKAGISVGGYSHNSGLVENVIVERNHLYKNNYLGKYYGAELIISKISNLKVISNSIYGKQDNFIYAEKNQKYFNLIFNEFSTANVTLDYNNYYADTSLHQIKIRWENKMYKGLDRYAAATKQDIHSTFFKPHYKDAENGNFEEWEFIEKIHLDGKMDEWFGMHDLTKYKLVASQFSVTNDERYLYIGFNPVGKDKGSSIYFDTDQKKETGYNSYHWKNVGADYIVEKGILYKHNGKLNEWKFDKIGKIGIVELESSSEYRIPLSLLYLEAGETVGIGIISRNGMQLPVKKQSLLQFRLK